VGCAFGFALLLPFFFDGAAHYQFLNFFPIRLALSRVIGAGAAIS